MNAKEVSPPLSPRLQDGYSQICSSYVFGPSGFWTLQNLIPSFPWIAPRWRDQILQSSNHAPLPPFYLRFCAPSLTRSTRSFLPISNKTYLEQRLMRISSAVRYGERLRVRGHTATGANVIWIAWLTVPLPEF